VSFAASIVRFVPGAHLRRVLRGFASAVVALAISATGQVSQPSSQAGPEDSFDVPLRKLTVDLGRSPYFPQDNIRNTLSCFYFPDLMIKQYDQGEVGSEWLAIHRFRGQPPECSMSHDPGERVIKASEWGGYFRGRKGSLVFFDGGECQQGACQFGVYELTTGKWIFQDDEAYIPEKEPPWDRMRVLSTEAGVVIRYLRVSYAECDLHAEGTACREQVKAKFHIKSDMMPHCQGYEPEALAHYAMDPNAPVESMIAYSVEVVLSASPVVQSVPGPMRCWPTH